MGKEKVVPSSVQKLREAYRKLQKTEPIKKEKKRKPKKEELVDLDKEYCCFCEKVCIEGSSDFHRIDNHMVCHRSCAKRRWKYDPGDDRRKTCQDKLKSA